MYSANSSILHSRNPYPLILLLAEPENILLSHRMNSPLIGHYMEQIATLGLPPDN